MADSKDMVCVEARFCLKVALAAGVEGRSRKKLHHKSATNHVTLQIVQNIYFSCYYHQITADTFHSSIIMKTIRKNKSSTTISDIPDGFTTRIRPDSQHYLVPQYMVPALDQEFASYWKKAELHVDNQPAGVSDVLNFK